MQKFISDKEEQAKYFQSEKEILEEAIEQMKREIEGLKEDLINVKSQRDNVGRDLDVAVSEKKRIE